MRWSDSYGEIYIWAELPHGMWDLPKPEIESMSLAIGRWILNHWTTREAPHSFFKYSFLLIFTTSRFRLVLVPSTRHFYRKISLEITRSLY